MKEFVDQIDDSAAPADASTAFASIADAGKIIKKAKDSGVASEDIAKTLVAEADVIVEMKEFVDQIDDSAAKQMLPQLLPVSQMLVIFLSKLKIVVFLLMMLPRL